MNKAKKTGSKSSGRIKDTSEDAVKSPSLNEKSKTKTEKRLIHSKKIVIKKDASEEKVSPTIMHLSSSVIQKAAAEAQAKTREMKKMNGAIDVIPGIPDSSSSIIKGTVRAVQSRNSEKIKNVSVETVKPSSPDLSDSQVKRVRKVQSKNEKVMKKEKKTEKVMKKEDISPVEKKVEKTLIEKDKEKKSVETKEITVRETTKQSVTAPSTPEAKSEKTAKHKAEEVAKKEDVITAEERIEKTQDEQKTEKKTIEKKGPAAKGPIKPTISASSSPKLKSKKAIGYFSWNGTKPKTEENLKKKEIPQIEEKIETTETEQEKEAVVKADELRESPADKGEIPGIPESSSSIIKGVKVTQLEAEKTAEKDVLTERKKEPEVKTGEIKEAIPADKTEGKSKTTGIFISVKETSGKVTETVGKILGKIDIKKSAGTAVSGLKYPVDAISTADKKVKNSMKKVVLFNAKNIEYFLQHINTYDFLLTKSAKKLMDSIVK